MYPKTFQIAHTPRPGTDGTGRTGASFISGWKRGGEGFLSIVIQRPETDRGVLQ
ncbi:unnamed protein product [Periconia digitata]|uniref:Uncharacterized protein n=1 Tax=Periconia digitata TaxID=1303443 RepID=A0A9W4UP35_9PLEO|nr:unnamed protein product [Periconia digitata]